MKTYSYFRSVDAQVCVARLTLKSGFRNVFTLPRRLKRKCRPNIVGKEWKERERERERERKR